MFVLLFPADAYRALPAADYMFRHEPTLLDGSSVLSGAHTRLILFNALLGSLAP